MRYSQTFSPIHKSLQMYCLELVSLFNRISTSMGYLMPKPYLENNSSGAIEAIARRIKEFMPFVRVISPKVNATARLKFELTHFEAAVHRFNYCAMGRYHISQVVLFKIPASSFCYFFALEICVRKCTADWYNSTRSNSPGNKFYRNLFFVI